MEVAKVVKLTADDSDYLAVTNPATKRVRFYGPFKDAVEMTSFAKLHKYQILPQ